MDGGAGGGRRGPGGDEGAEERRERAREEAERFDDERRRAAETGVGKGGELPETELAALGTEEHEVRERIAQVEAAMERILHHPLGEDGLGRRKVWRLRPPRHIWSEIAGERTTVEAVKDSAGVVSGAALGAVRTTAAVVKDTAATVVGWTYKPALWSAMQAATSTVSTAVSGVAAASKLVYSGMHTSANVLIETVDENAASLDALQAELAELSDRLGAVEARRTRATLRLLAPCEGSVWYTEHACSVQWQSTGTITDLRLSLHQRVSLSGTPLAAGVLDCGAYTYMLPRDVAEGWYYVRLEGPRGVPRTESALFEVRREVPPLMVWARGHRLTFHRGEEAVLQWALREGAEQPPHDAAARQATHLGVAPGEAQALVEAGAPHVKLYLAPRLAPAWRVLADGLPLSGAFHWQVPVGCTQGTYAVQAKAKALAPGAPAVTSPTIYVTVKDELRVVLPRSGAEWHVGALYQVEWSCAGAPRDDVAVNLGTRFFKVETLAEGQQESGSLWWKVPESLRPGWYFLSISAAGSRLAASSDWILVSPPREDAASSEAEAGEDRREAPHELLAPSAPPLPGALDNLLAPPPPHLAADKAGDEHVGISV